MNDGQEYLVTQDTDIDQHTRIIGFSDEMLELTRIIGKFAETDKPILIQGESGAGKELVARTIHNRSKRGTAEFVALNCSAIPPDLIESMMFGHIRGAFSGAVQDGVGFVKRAHQGTLFLDEISSATHAFQVKLLRYLDTGVYYPVGETTERHSDARIITAAISPLLGMIKEGKFRDDLYYRIATVTLLVPPLRTHLSDIPFLVRHLTDALNIPEIRIDPEVYEKLVSHHWPGNVRELQNVISRAAILCHEHHITADDISFDAIADEGGIEIIADDVSKGDDVETPTILTDDLNALIEKIRREQITTALKLSDGNKARAARRLGLQPKTLLNFCRKRGI